MNLKMKIIFALVATAAFVTNACASNNTQTNNVADVDQIIQAQIQVTKEATQKFARDFADNNSTLSMADFRAKIPTILSSLDKALVVFHDNIRKNVYDVVRPYISHYNTIYHSKLSKEQKERLYPITTDAIRDYFAQGGQLSQAYQTEIWRLLTIIKSPDYKTSAIKQCLSSSCIQLSLNFSETLLQQISDNLLVDLHLTETEHSNLIIPMDQVRTYISKEMDELKHTAFVDGFIKMLPFDVDSLDHPSIDNVEHSILFSNLKNAIRTDDYNIAPAIRALQENHLGPGFYLSAPEVAELELLPQGIYDLLRNWDIQQKQPSCNNNMHIISATMAYADFTSVLAELCNNRSTCSFNTFELWYNNLGGEYGTDGVLGSGFAEYLKTHPPNDPSQFTPIMKSKRFTVHWNCGLNPNEFVLDIGRNIKKQPTDDSLYDYSNNADSKDLTLYNTGSAEMYTTTDEINPATIHVLSSTYGNKSQTEELKNLCDKTLFNCAFKNHVETSNDPIPGKSKQLLTQWTCGDDPTINTINFGINGLSPDKSNTAEGKTFTVSCPALAATNQIHIATTSNPIKTNCDGLFGGCSISVPQTTPATQTAIDVQWTCGRNSTVYELHDQNAAGKTAGIFCE